MTEPKTPGSPDEQPPAAPANATGFAPASGAPPRAADATDKPAAAAEASKPDAESEPVLPNDSDPSLPTENPSEPDLVRLSDSGDREAPTSPGVLSDRPSFIAPPIRDPRWPWLVVAAAAGALAIAVAVAKPEDAPKPVVTTDAAGPVLPPLEMAAQLRHDADADYVRHAWQACLDKLDRARTLDPKGEATLEVQRLRQGAAAALGSPEKAAPPPDEKKPRP
jgi:hypothetical protein